MQYRNFTKRCPHGFAFGVIKCAVPGCMKEKKEKRQLPDGRFVCKTCNHALPKSSFYPIWPSGNPRAHCKVCENKKSRERLSAGRAYAIRRAS